MAKVMVILAIRCIFHWESKRTYSRNAHLTNSSGLPKNNAEQNFVGSLISVRSLFTYDLADIEAGEIIGQY